MGKVLPCLLENVGRDVFDLGRLGVHVVAPQSEHIGIPRFVLHQREAAPLRISVVCGIGVLLWVEACDVDQRVALVSEAENTIDVRILVEALGARIDVQLLAVAVGVLLEGFGVRAHELGE